MNLSSLLLLISIIGLLCGCSSENKPATDNKEAAPKINVQTVHPRRGEIARNIVLPANIRAYQQATHCAKVTGYLKSIDVDKGDNVKAGDVLAEVEVPEL